MSGKLILPFTLLLLFSCSGIRVLQGPYSIETDLVLSEGKQEYLDKISAVTSNDDVPNIILIVADDLGKYDISTYTAEGVHTPAIDMLASRGVRFNQAYATCSVCSPSRVSMLTGRYQQRFGYERQPMNRYARNKLEYWFVDHLINTYPMQLMDEMARPPKEEVMKQGVPESEILLSEILQKRGYRTGIIGKWHMGQAEQHLPTNRGFDMQYGFYEAFTLFAPVDDPDIVNYRHDYFANKHIWRQGREGSCAIREQEHEIEEKKYLTFAIADRATTFIEENSSSRFFLYLPFSAPHTPFQAPLRYYNMFPHVKDQNKRVYYAMIAALDDAIMQVLETLEEHDLTKQTMVIFTSDNGGAAYTGATDNGELKGGKFTQFEGGINIPLVISYPGHIPGGTQCDLPVSLMDIFTTSIMAAECTLPDDRPLDGTDLLSAVANQEQFDAQRDLFWRTDYNYAMVSGSWKYILNIRYNQEFLYNLSEDPGEQNNLATKFPEKTNAFRKNVLEWSSQMKQPLWPGVMEYIYDLEGDSTFWAI